jgi:hypothetical protein
MVQLYSHHVITPGPLRSNSGVVDIYEYKRSPERVCRLLRTLAPPRRSRQVNVKVTCVKLDPRGRLLGVANILGHVSVVLLNTGQEGANRSHRVIYAHTAHKVSMQGSVEDAFGRNDSAQCDVHLATTQEAVRCLEWDSEGVRLFSGCEGGLVVETSLPQEHVEQLLLSSNASSSPARAGGRGLAGILSGKPLASLFQGPSHGTYTRGDSEVLQVRQDAWHHHACYARLQHTC